MLDPADIEARDFLVVVHGYHKGEVRAFLEEIAAVHAELLDRIEEVAASTTADDLDSIGMGIANILKAAKESAADVTAEAAAILADAKRDAERMRSEAETVLVDARTAAERTERDAADRAQAIGLDAEARVRNRLDEVQGREAAIRVRLDEVVEELRLARLTLDGGAIDLRDHDTEVVEIARNLESAGPARS